MRLAMEFVDIKDLIANFKKKGLVSFLSILLYIIVMYNKEIYEYSTGVFDNKLNVTYTTNYVVYGIWWYTEENISEIRSFLYEFYPYNNLTEKQIELHIDNILKTNTNKYIKEFNIAPLYKDNIGTWYRDEFRYVDFLEDIMDIININVPFNNEGEKSLIIENKIGIITEIMKSYNSEIHIKLINHLNEN